MSRERGDRAWKGGRREITNAKHRDVQFHKWGLVSLRGWMRSSVKVTE